MAWKVHREQVKALKVAEQRRPDGGAERHPVE
jgi:hypothetical protein